MGPFLKGTEVSSFDESLVLVLHNSSGLHNILNLYMTHSALIKK